MSRSQRIIDLFRRRFVQRDDCYPLQYCGNGGGYKVIKERLTEEVVLAHLKGTKTIGLYGAAGSTTKWLCVDIDDLDEVAVREPQNHARRFGIPYLTEFSGKKGYHLWVFFDKPYPNRIARALARAFAFDNEVFPKQNYIAPGKLGSLVKAPLGKHQVTGNWCLFLDKDLRPEKDQYGVLARIQTINPIQLLRRDLPGLWAEIESEKRSRAGPVKGVPTAKIPIIKDCIRNAVLTGASEGKRNEVGHIIAAELRAAGVSQYQAEIILNSVWNQRNRPPLGEDEINVIVSSAFGEKEYAYGCKEDNPLRQHLECVGSGKCFYLTILRNLHRND